MVYFNTNLNIMKTTKNQLIFLKGLPASGKSTWAKEYIRSHKNAIRVNKDDLRAMCHDQIHTKEREELIKAIQMKIATMAMGRGYDTIIVDNTHLEGTHEWDYKAMIENYNLTGGVQWEFVIKEFPTSVDTCVERDEKRGVWRVGEAVIRSMSKRTGWGVVSPKRDFTEVQMDKNLPSAIIVDIDGTLAKMEGRSPYDYTRVMEDSLHEDVDFVINNFLDGVEKNTGVRPAYIIVSGRKDDCKKETEEWLMSFGIPYSQLHMRKSNDIRKDSQVKYEILFDLAKEFNILAAFDDRNQVVAMWRQAGLRCFQVADGDF